MSKDFLANAFDGWQAAVGEVLLNVEFIESAATLRPRLGGYLAWNTVDEDAKKLLRSFMGARCDASTSYEGLFVRLVGAFEEFMRRIVRDAVVAINDSKATFERIREGLRNRNRNCVGQALTTVFEPVDFHRLDFDRLCRELGTCVPEAEGVTLSADAFGIAVRGIAADRIESAFNLLGAKLDWDKLAESEDLKEALGTRRPRETARAAKERLQTIQSRRNGYAHTGIGGLAISAQDVRAAAAFFSGLAAALKGRMERAVAEAHVPAGR
ncbi:MAG TPA: hypothetical protein VNA25_14375 [Phycisphaerae bacterium]|nr:hypothetical protein [Phycisphaerae bacterium]